MKLYIDPGTGSMLFAILIGIIGALNFALRGWIIKLRFLLSGGEKTAVDQEKHPLAVFVDDKRYWNVMEPVCRELDRRGLDVAYLTASPDDPALQNPYAHVHAEFLGEGNKAFAKLNFLRANVLLSTTPGLDVYQWKRSPGVDCYVHILHAANEVAGYRMFGIDYYDTVFVSGDYQIRDLRALEALRGLPAKEVVKIGIPYMDEMKRRLDAAGPVAPHRTTVLIAPTCSSPISPASSSISRWSLTSPSSTRTRSLTRAPTTAGGSTRRTGRSRFCRRSASSSPRTTSTRSATWCSSA